MTGKDIFNRGKNEGAGKTGSRIQRVSLRDIAIIGTGCKLPIGNTVQAFWQNLEAGVDGVARFPGNRIAEVNNYLHATGQELLSPEQFKEKGFLDHIDLFDNKYFNISHKEACLMNPSQRLFLEVVWHAFQDGGYAPDALKGTRTGVYVGFTERNEGYYNLVNEMEPELSSMAHPGNVASILASRVSYLLDLKGPTMLVDTACSSSLVAVHTACQALRNGEIDMAIAGGVNLSWLPVKAPEGSGIGIESKSGRARTFDDNSDGTVGGEGVVAMMLKPLATAIKDGDNVIAVIKGSAINQDGKSIGITAPSMLAQVAVIEQAWEDAGITPDTLSYMEAHGTATNLGDPIEIEAITQAFRKYTQQKQFCAIGAIKTNIGHLDAAAGIAGLLKAALSLHHKKIPPHLHFERPNRKIKFETSPVYVNDRLRNWEVPVGMPRRCGVSSFGISGTNCHLVLEEAPARPIVENEGFPQVACFSAKQAGALETLVNATLQHLKATPGYSLSDVCYTLGTGREHHAYRVAFTVTDAADLEIQMEVWCKSPLHTVTTSKDDTTAYTIAADQLLGQLKHVISIEQASALCVLYVQGASINWQNLYAKRICRKTNLPGYPFEAKRCWVNYPVNTAKKITPIMQTDRPVINVISSQDRIMAQMKEVIAGVFELEASDIDATLSFLEMGLDSISIIQVKQLVRSRYNIDVSIDALFNEASSLEKLAVYISNLLPEEKQAEVSPVADVQAVAQALVTVPTSPVAVINIAPVNVTPTVSSFVNSNSSMLETIVAQQLKIMSDQLAMLAGNPVAAMVAPAAVTAPVQGTPAATASPVEKVLVPGASSATTQQNDTRSTNIVSKKATVVTPNFQWTSTAFSDFDAQQQANLKAFITAFNQRTKASKAQVQNTREHFANNRNTAHYNKALKELSYPIIMQSAKGARMWDLDGNEYIDMSMGFGVFLLGYNHPVVEAAVKAHAGNYFLGPMSQLPGEVAQLLHELTGAERVAFYNSGTEAVMVALRLSRAATGRKKIVMFAGSYHGTFDGVLAQKDRFSAGHQAIPKGAGIPESMLEDVLLLDYGTPESLEIIRAHADELAAVLVEPVQSRKPEFQPVAFLQELRALTTERGITLIFDEIISGFRIHPGGCQHVFGVTADLVTYGKIPGGGLPLGIVAGKSAFMHGIDGGEKWQYGDDSQPVFDHRKIFVAGTFCHHPLTMAAAKAMLGYLKAQGPALQETLNKRMQALATELNTFFQEESLPISIVNFGSLFQIRSGVELSLFFHHLAFKGIYVWEGMTLFISEAHTDADLATFVNAVKETIFEMREKGFLTSLGAERSQAQKNTNSSVSQDVILTTTLAAGADPAPIPLSFEQRRLWFKATAHVQANIAFNAHRTFHLREAIDKTALNAALSSLVARHEILQTIKIDGNFLELSANYIPDVTFITLPENEAGAWKRDFQQTPFDLANGPLFRVAVVTQDGACEVLLSIHSIIADGWSLNIIASELQELYVTSIAGSSTSLNPAPSFRSYVSWLQTQHDSSDAENAYAFWKQQLGIGIAPLQLPTIIQSKPEGSTGGGLVLVLTKEHTNDVKKFAQQNGVSVFMLMLGAFENWLQRVSGQSQVVIGIPAAGQLLMDAPGIVGQCNQLIPYLHNVNAQHDSKTFLQSVKQNWLQFYKYQRFSSLDLLIAKGEAELFPAINVVFNVDPANRDTEVSFIAEDTVYSKAGENKYDFFLNVIESGGVLRLHFQFNKSLFPEALVQAWVSNFSHLLYGMIAAPATAVGALSVGSQSLKSTTVSVANVAWNVLFDAVAMGEPNALALSIGLESFTYGQLRETADLFAMELAGIGIRQGTVVAITTNELYETLIAILAVLKAGASYYLPENAGDALPQGITAIVHENATGQQHNILLQINIEEWFTAGTISLYDAVPHPVNGTAAAKLLSINSATIAIPHAGFIDYCRAITADANTREHEIIFPSLQRNISTDLILAIWLQGGHVTLKEIPVYDGKESRLYVDKHQWTEWLADAPSLSLGAAKQIALIAETPLTALHIERWEAAAGKDNKGVYFYAAPAVPMLLSRNVLAATDDAMVLPLSEGFAGTCFVLNDAQGNVLPAGVKGALYVTLPGTKQPVQTGVDAARTSESSITPDVFSMQPAYAWASLSESIMLYTGIAGLTILPDEKQVLFIDAEVGVHALQHLENYLETMGVPVAYQPLSYGRVAPGVDAKGLLHDEEIIPLYAPGKPAIQNSDPVEENMLSLFRRLFPKRKTLSAGSNFFALGGTSINGIQLLSWIYKEWGVKLDIAQLFEHPEVKQLAGLVKKAGYGSFQQIPSLPEATEYEASHAQKRLWILDQNETESLAYNMSSVYVFNGHFDQQAFAKALTALVERHEILRTTFFNTEGNIWQRVHATGAYGFGLEVTDLQQDANREAIANEIAVRERNTAFDLEHGPLLRARLLVINPSRRIFIFTLHHIVSDGWSKEIITSEVTALYNAFLENTTAALPALRIQYKDFTHWQNEQLRQGAGVAAKAYWHQHFSGPLPILDMPSDFARPSIRTQNGANLYTTIDAGILQQAVDMANANGCTLFTLFFAVVKTLLFKYSGQEDMILGLPTSGRDHPDTENLIGLFVHTLPIRTSFKGADTFADFLQVVKRNMMDAYRHQIYPVDQLVEDLGVSWEISRRPLFDVMVNWLDMHEELDEATAGTLDGDKIEIVRSNSMFDLSFSFNAAANHCQDININFNTDIFSPETIRQMLAHFVALLKNVLKDSSTTLENISCLSEEETTSLLQLSGDGKSALPAANLVALFEKIVSRNANTPALQCGSDSLTFQQLNEQANRLADCLVKDYGVKPGDRVGIITDRNTWMVTSVLAVFKAGAAYVPLDPAYAADRVSYMLSDSGVQVLISDGTTTLPVNNIRVADLQLFAQQAENYNAQNRPTQPGTDDLAYIIYTSGSTGQPKGVMIAHRELLGLYDSLGTAYSLDNFEVRLLQVASFSFDVFVGDLLRSIFRGNLMVICTAAQRYDMTAFYELLQTHRISMVESSPGLLLPLLDYVYEENKDLSFLKVLNMGSDALLVEDYRKAYERFGGKGLRIVNSYGTTETTIDSSFYEGIGADLRTLGYVPIGRPLSNSRMYVLDKQLRLCAPGITGELCIGGAGLGRGYWNRPDLTAEKYVDNPFVPGEKMYRTGDLARWNRAGNIEFLGRSDNQVKIRGYRIEPGEVESTLLHYAGVQEAVVLAHQLDGKEKQLVSYIVWNGEEDEKGLRDYCREKLPLYMHPTYYVTLAAMPLTSNGKINRLQLPLPSVNTQAVYEAPRNEMEVALVKIWEEVLQREHISIKDNFFDLGGHSLKGIRVIWRVRKELGTNLTFPDIFNYPRIIDLAELLTRPVENKVQTQVLSAIEQLPKYELSHGQLRMWILAQMEESRSAYNMCMSFELRDVVDREALLNSFNQLLDRHEVLRTSFINDAAGVWQQVKARGDCGFVVNWTNLIDRTTKEQQQALGQLSASEVQHKFDLQKDALLRAHVLTMKEDFSVLLINMHHIISDGWSIEVMMEELQMMYEGHAKKEPVVIEPLRIQYKEYATWQNKLLNSPEIESYKNYWLSRFEGELPVLNLPLDYTRPAVRSYRGATVRKVMSREDTRLLKAVVQQEPDKSMFMVLLAAINALLHRYTGQEDVILGILVAGREQDDLLGQIGLYVNTLALRTRFNAKESFDALLENVQDGLLGAFENQVYPFDLLVEHLDIDGDRSRSPLFDILVTYKKDEEEIQQERAPVKNEDEVSMSDLQREDSNISKFDMTISFREAADGIYMSINYCTDLFSDTRIVMMLDHLQEIMRSISINRQQAVATMPYLTAAENKLLLQTFTNTAKPFPVHKTIPALITEQATRTPEAIALVHEENQVTYAGMESMSNMLAHHLINTYNITPGKTVGVLMERTEKMIITLLAILKTGAAYVPVDVEYPAERIEYILQDSKPDVIISDSAVKVPLQDGQQLINGKTIWNTLDPRHEHQPDAQIDPTGLAYLIYTSGSTGRPKGVKLSHRNAVSFIDWCEAEFAEEHFDTVFAVTSYCFDLSIFEMFYTLSAGKQLLVLKSAVDLQRYMNVTPNILLNTVPSVIDSLIKLGADFKNVKLINMAGEPVPRATREYFKGSGIIVRNLYGPSEDTTYSTCYQFSDTDDLILIGKPIANTRIYIVDKQDKLVPVGFPGEICISGTGLALGYLGQPQLTAEKFVSNPFEAGERMYRTGDLGRWTADGNIDYLGRNDDQVKIRGYRIELGEIQSVIVKHESVREGVVLAIPVGGADKELVAYIVWAGTPQDAVLNRYMRDKLPVYMQPAHYLVLDKLPLNSNGKIDKKALPAPQLTTTVQKPIQAAANATEQQLIDIWADILQREDIGITDNFFEIGGHSLKGMRVLARVNAAFNVRFTLKDIFKKTTVQQMAAAIDAAGQGADAKPNNKNLQEIII